MLNYHATFTKGTILSEQIIYQKTSEKCKPKLYIQYYINKSSKDLTVVLLPYIHAAVQCVRV